MRLGWTSVALGEVATIRRSLIAPENISPGTLYVGLENIGRGGALTGVRPVAPGQLASAKFVFSTSEILFGKLRPNLAKIACPDFPGVCSTDILPITPGPRVTRAFLAYYLAQPVVVDLAAQRAAGAHLPRLSPQELQKFQVPLPPLDEQRRIARMLGLAATAMQSARRAVRLISDEMPEAEFSREFGDVRTNTRGWPTMPLSDIARLFAGASLPSGMPYTDQPDGYLLMKVSDMNLPGNETHIGRCASWRPSAGSRDATCPPHSVVIPKRGAAIATNKKRITTRSTILDPNLMAIWPDEAIIDLEFIYRWLMVFDLAEITSGSSVPQLNKRDLAPLAVPVPPLRMQRQFAALARAVRERSLQYQARALHASALFAGLQQQAFSGTL